jgi:hypothetical protein
LSSKYFHKNGLLNDPFVSHDAESFACFVNII